MRKEPKRAARRGDVDPPNASNGRSPVSDKCKDSGLFRMTEDAFGLPRKSSLVPRPSEIDSRTYHHPPPAQKFQPPAASEFSPPTESTRSETGQTTRGLISSKEPIRVLSPRSARNGRRAAWRPASRPGRAVGSGQNPVVSSWGKDAERAAGGSAQRYILNWFLRSTGLRNRTAAESHIQYSMFNIYAGDDNTRKSGNVRVA